MEYLLRSVICILILIIVILAVRLGLMKKAAREIRTAFAEKLQTETNTLIGISSRDPEMRRLAADINVQLAALRGERRRFQHGDLELKEAVTNISHDLRTPLTAICGYLDLLSEETLPETARRYLSQIENRTEVMKQLTEELFRYSMVSLRAGTVAGRDGSVPRPGRVPGLILRKSAGKIHCPSYRNPGNAGPPVSGSHRGHPHFQQHHQQRPEVQQRRPWMCPWGRTALSSFPTRRTTWMLSRREGCSTVFTPWNPEEIPPDWDSPSPDC